jgi:uncharacterized protein YqeY
MSLSDRITADLTAAMKARDAETTSTLRMVVAAIRNAKVASGRSGRDLSDDETLELLTREAKKRSEAADAYAQAGRSDLADKEQRELHILRGYLPAQLGEDELRGLVDEAVTQTGASGPGDLGTVMSALMPKVKGRADGKQVNALVRERLAAG